MRETAASSVEAAGLYRTVGIPVVEGLAAFHHDAYAEAVELLLPVRFDLWQIGGSHAQRDVVDLTLTEAAVRARAAGRLPSRLRMNAWGPDRPAPQTAAFSAMPRTSRADRPDWAVSCEERLARRSNPDRASIQWPEIASLRSQ